MKLHKVNGLSLVEGDCVAALAKFADNRFDSVVTDGPYGLAFMGKVWDGADAPVFSVEFWRAVLRVLKPGGHLLSFGGTRTYHRMTCAIEDAGFEIRDSLHWFYGTGFPKSLNVAKAVEATERFGGSGSRQLRARDGFEVGTVGTNMNKHRSGRNDARDGEAAAVTSVTAERFSAIGTALKPGHEPIVLARKPLDGTVAANVVKWGTGGLNIDACRLGTGTHGGSGAAFGGGWADGSGLSKSYAPPPPPPGRWPANVLLDPEAADELDAQSGGLRARGNVTPTKRGDYAAATSYSIGAAAGPIDPGDSGGASRFFYVAKPSRAERDLGCEGLPARTGGEATERADDSAGVRNPRAGANRGGGARNAHPTVKPIALMRYLVRLITPPGGNVLDPFTGSGTTGIAAKLEGRGFLGIEREPEYVRIALARMAAAGRVSEAA